MMRKTQVKSRTSRNTIKTRTITKNFFPKGRGRLAAFLILALLATAATVITISSAQSKRRARARKQTSSQRASSRKASPKIMSPEELFESREEGPRTARMGANGQQEEGISRSAMGQGVKERKRISLKPKEVRLNRAKAWNGDLRDLPYIPAVKRERPEREGPEIEPVPYGVTEGAAAPSAAPQESSAPAAPEISAPAPAPLSTFEGLDNVNWGAGHPPDTVGDVGPNHYIQSINSSIGIYNKATGARIAAFTLDTFMSQGAFGNLCDTDNFGDPVVVYDTFEDRWVISDFAFQLNAAGDVSPQIALQCFAVSKTGDPVSGGWNYYSINTTGGLGDYPKLGVWPDGIYMSVNMFGYGASDAFQNPRVYAFNKAQMYAGAPSVQSVEFNAPSTEFSLLPSNARLQTGTPPAGSPNYFTVVAQYLNVISVYKLKADWNNISTSTFTGPFDSLNTTWWAQLAAANQTAPTPGSRNDELYARLMMQNQYTNIGGVESLWNSMTAGLGNPTANTTATQSAVRYYQLKVTGGTVEANTSQAFTYSPADTIWRYMPSLAIDRAGNMAMGYSTSNATTHPTITYAGRLATDPVNSITQTDQLLFAGTGSQSGTTRWGDYAAMSLDPDGCTFWFTSEYYATTGLNHQTRVGSFKYPQCTPVGNGGTISGTVTANPGGGAIAGATVTLGSRTTTTDASGNYSFTVPAGTYPGMTASFPGRTAATVSTIVVTDNNTTTRNFSLSGAAASGCLVDTSQADFQAGIPTNTDVATSAGNVQLATSQGVDAQSTTETQAFGFSNTSWFGQTFTPTVTGQATQVALDLFCSTCTGTPPNVVISIRNAASNLPTGADLASASIPFSNSDAGGFYTATFASPPTLTAGTQYAIVVRMAASYATGTPAYVTSTSSAYAGGRRTTSANSGTSWTGTTPDTSFKVTMKTGFKTSGDFVSSLKDANPAAGSVANWGTFSWTATTPAGTTLKFQAAASNSANGPFTYVGPDGTASTFFTSGASLSQFNGKRYLRYKALFTGTAASSPTLADVTVCFSDVPSIVTSTLTAAAATGTYGGTVNLSATLTDGTNGVSGKSIAFTLNGNSVGSGTTNASGVATVSNVSLSGVNAGSYPTGVGASFAGDSGYTSSTSTAALTVNKADTTTTVTVSNANYDGNPHGGAASVTGPANLNQSLTVSYAGRNGTTYGPSNTAPTNGGDYTASASYAGDSNYNASSDSKDFSIGKANQSITFGALADKTYGDADFNVSATATSGLAVSFNASGACTVTGNTVHITGGGSCTVTATQAGDSNYNAAADVPRSFNIAKANQTITFGALSDKTFGDADFNVSASSTSGLTVSFGATGACTVTGTTVHLTGAGSCTITASQAGDSNYNAASDVARSFNIAKASASVVLSNLSQTYDGTPKSATATTTPGGLNVVISYAPTSQALRKKNTAALNPINAGSYTVTATIDDPNYEGSASDTLVIAKADANVSVTGFTGNYDGSSHSASGTATGAQGEDLASLFDFGASYTNVPGGTAHWTFNASGTNANYNSQSGDVQITISKATPSITWANPADIIYGTALGAAQLNASANTPGAFTYTPAAGTVLASGAGQNLHASFTPTDSVNYNAASADASINVLSATLSVSMIADRNPAPVGLNFNYKATVSNTGNAPSANTVLTDVLPTQVTFTAASSTQGACSYASATRTVTCNVGSIPAGGGAMVTITVKPREEGTLNDTATITASQWDPATGNSSASVNGIPAQKFVDLSVSKTDSVDPIFVGDNTVYTMVVKNSNTEINATGVTLSDSLPSGMTFVSATTSQGSLITPPVGSTGIVTASIGTMAPNATVTVTVTVKGASAGVQVNSATVSGNETDTNSSNNSATQSTTVKAVVVVSLQKVLLAKQVLTGGCENTTGQVYLTAPAPAGGVNVTLSSNVTGASVPSSVFIAGGQMVSPAFTVTTNSVSAKQIGLVTATSGPNSVSRGITINVGGGTCP